MDFERLKIKGSVLDGSFILRPERNVNHFDSLTYARIVRA
ncbi:hypothetical protein BTN50_0499 [Candidatus Enterovibrio altilux]|uniref:Uncharacterized protein n=1 Tax=Candidatus Enterovibrio altilux TaxID=1927128 RepID=A0A291B7Q0_9GAMM|nr:hypothetical protein BTN50_0499 [Candidatus Enterovibrio luxaltus]